MKTFLIITQILFVLNVNAQIHKEYYDSGKLMAEGLKENNELTGVWRFYFESNILKSTGTYEHNKRIGEWKFYNENGLLYENGYTLKLRENIVYMIENKNIAVNLGQNARKTVENNYCIDIVVKKYLSLF